MPEVPSPPPCSPFSHGANALCACPHLCSPHLSSLTPPFLHRDLPGGVLSCLYSDPRTSPWLCELKALDGAWLEGVPSSSSSLLFLPPTPLPPHSHNCVISCCKGWTPPPSPIPPPCCEALLLNTLFSNHRLCPTLCRPALPPLGCSLVTGSAAALRSWGDFEALGGEEPTLNCDTSSTHRCCCPICFGMGRWVAPGVGRGLLILSR